jgi:hypothetical protein
LGKKVRYYSSGGWRLKIIGGKAENNVAIATDTDKHH